jgi:uncharacterized protein YdhG (YjbR/CyaY superfamily)
MDAEVKAYIERATDDRRALYDKLHEIILKQYPKADLVMWYGVPTYKTKTGRVCLAFWKSGVTLSSYDAAHVAEFKAQHPEIKAGTVSVSFKASDKIPLAALKNVIKLSMESDGE